MGNALLLNKRFSFWYVRLQVRLTEQINIEKSTSKKLQLTNHLTDLIDNFVIEPVANLSKYYISKGINIKIWYFPTLILHWVQFNIENSHKRIEHGAWNQLESKKTVDVKLDWSKFHILFQVIAAEGEQKASRALREAAAVIAESPSALQVTVNLQSKEA